MREIGIPAVRDHLGRNAKPVAQVVGCRLAHDDHRVGCAEPLALLALVEATLHAGREGRAQGLEAPRVAKLSDPGVRRDPDALSSIIIGIMTMKSSEYIERVMKNIDPLMIIGDITMRNGIGILSGRRGSVGRLNSLVRGAGCSRGGRL